jgi:hypothetical protein
MLTASKICRFIRGGIPGKEMSGERTPAQFAASEQGPSRRREIVAVLRNSAASRFS